MGYTHIKPGCEIEVSAHIYPNKADQRVAELTGWLSSTKNRFL